MHTITLKLVTDLGSGSEFFDSISDSDVVNAWPGTPTVVDLTVPPQLVRPVWIGVSADGLSSKPYPLSTTVAAIVSAGWPRVYQGTEIQDADGNVQVFSDQYAHVLAAIAACCASQVNTAAFSLKQSNYPLTVGEPLPCGTEAIFKWLAVYGSVETASDLEVRFRVELINADATVDLSEVFYDQPFTSTLQAVKSWPADFVGLTVEGVTLVGNDTVPGPGEMRVGDFDGGTIIVAVTILDGALDVVKSSLAEFALPGTDCDDNQSASDSSIFDSQFSEQFS